MRTKIAVAAVAAALFTGLLVGCNEPEQKTDGSAPPAAQPTAGMDHAAMGHGASSSDRAMNHAMGTSGMESLRGKTGEAFDRAFLSQMIAHHAAAVRMAEDALGTAAKPETKREALDILSHLFLGAIMGRTPFFGGSEVGKDNYCDTPYCTQ